MEIDRPINTAEDGVLICQELLKNRLFNLLAKVADTCSLLFPGNPNFLCAKAEALDALGKHAQAFDLFDRALNKSSITPLDLHNLTARMNTIIPHLRPMYVSYPHHIVQRIINQEPAMDMVTFTVTTCKRLDLFIPTMNSFLNCCLDLHLISRWILVDDNSSEDDRRMMKKMYPFFTFIFKGPEDRGHPRSMNLLRKAVVTPFVFHMEDDWLFVAQKNYISDCLNVLSSSPKIAQCLVNRNFAETEKDNIKGGFLRYSPDHLRYVEHQYIEDQAAYAEFMKTAGPNVAYWPHYSFRPSLLRRAVWDAAPFREDPCHFEMEHSKVLHKQGWISAFLPATYSLHTGKLTSEKHSDKPNAYTLNQTSQFGSSTADEKKPIEKPSFGAPRLETWCNLTITDLDEDIKNRIRSIEVAPVKHHIGRYVINLDRRQDRFDTFCKTWAGVERFSATDGESLRLTPAQVRLWGMNDHNWSKGIMGCAYSHLRLWQQLLNSSSSAYFILEDDTERTDNSDSIHAVLDPSFDLDYDILFLGYSERNHAWSPPDAGNASFVQLKSTAVAMSMFLGGAFAYLISRRGAAKMMAMVNSAGMINAIDTLMLRLCDCGNVFWAANAMAKSRLANFDTAADSDIQHNLFQRPVQGAPTVRQDHLDYLAGLCSRHGFVFVSVRPDSVDTKTVYHLTVETSTTNVQAPNTHVAYWLTRNDVIVMPRTLLDIVEATEGWRLTLNNEINIQRLLAQ